MATIISFRKADDRKLQWGHGREAVDGIAGACGVRAHSDASMGPRPRGRGWHDRPAAGQGAPHASMGPRPRGRVWPRVTAQELIGIESFIGATAARPWMARGGHRVAREFEASMGPRPRGRGWTPSGCATGPRGGGFNGATAARPWMGSLFFSEVLTTCGFNGATAARPWMADSTTAMPARWLWLQWGHGREAVDGLSAPVGQGVITSFNGATAARPWMATRSTSGCQTSWASMGPRPRGRGWSRGRVCPVRHCALQWGHGREAVDGVWRPVAQGRRDGASMGPRPRGRGWSRSRPPLR